MIRERVVHATSRLDLLDPMMPRWTRGGHAAVCYSEDHGRKGWRGPLYLHHKEPEYAGGAAHFNAEVDAWLHDRAEHLHREVDEPSWEDVLSGKAARERHARLPAEMRQATLVLGVPFATPRERLADFWQEFVKALLDYPRALGEYLGFERKS